MNEIVRAAKSYLELGLSVLPISEDKRPPIVYPDPETRYGWTKYQTEPINPIRFEYDYNKHNAKGVGIICGKVSGGLECLDIDCKNDKTGTLWIDFCAELEDQSSGLIQCFFVEKSVNGGYHLVYRLRDRSPDGNIVLSRNEEGEVLIETRGEGGYFACTPTKGYTVWQGSLSKLPTISEDEHEILLGVAKSFDCIPEKDSVYQHKEVPSEGYIGLTPNDDYDSDSGNLFYLLESFGWKISQGRRGEILTRPGKEKGISATFDQKNKAGLRNRLYVHSSSVKNLPVGKLLKPSAVYALLKHDGDYSKASKSLYKQGYGDRMKQFIEEEKGFKIYPKCEATPQFLAQEFLKTQPPLYFVREEFYQYNGICYKVIEKNAVKSKIQGFIMNIRIQDKNGVFPYQATSKNINDLVLNVEMLQCRKFQNNEIIGESLQGKDGNKLIVLKNGILDIKTNKLENHTPDYFSTIDLKIDYNPQAECPNWLKFIGKQVDVKSQSLIREWFGYNLLKTNPKSKYMVFYGLPGSGKSTALEILQELVGEGNYSAFTFAGMSSEFGLSHYVNKQAIFSGDAHLSSLSSDKFTAVLERLKGITGNDLIEINRKGKAFISIHLPLKITFAVNEIPRFNDKANALIRRILVCNFPHSVAEKDQIENLKDIFRSELSGILNYALTGLQWLEEGHQFSFIDEELKTEFKESNNPVQMFINEECIADKDASIGTKELFKAWEAYCEENGFKGGSSSSFGVSLSSLGILKKRSSIGDRAYFYMGIDLQRNNKT